MCTAREAQRTACWKAVVQPVLGDRSAVCNWARPNRKSMYPATYPTSILGLTFSRQASSPLSVSLSLCLLLFLFLAPSLQCASFKVTASLFRGCHFFFRLCFVSEWSGLQAEEEDAVLKRMGVGWRAGCGVSFPPDQILMKWWQLEERTTNSLNAGHMTYGLGYLLEHFEWSWWSWERGVYTPI